MELEAERISPTLTSRYMNNYVTSPTDIYHQNYHSPRQNLQSFYPVMENDRNYLKRHYFVKDEIDGDEKERKYEKLIDHQGYPHPYHTNELYDSYNNNTLYPETTQERSTTADSNSLIVANSNSNDNYPINSSPASSIEDASEKITDSPKSVASGKKTKGRVKIKMEYIENKLRRYTTFSKRKTGIMKKVSDKTIKCESLNLSKHLQMTFANVLSSHLKSQAQVSYFKLQEHSDEKIALLSYRYSRLNFA